MAERSHEVIYRAVAQFDDARKKAKEFRDELKALKAEQEGLGKTASSTAQAQEQAEKKATAATQDHAKATRESIRATREATEETRKLGDESEKTFKKFRSIQSIGKNFGNEFGASLRSLSNEMRKAWKEADAGESAFQKLRRALAAAGGGGGGNNFFTTLAGGADALGRSVTQVLSKLSFWPAVILAAAAAAGPLVAILGSLGAVALGAGSALISMAGSVAALPGLLFAAATGVGALIAAITPIAGALKAYQAAQDAASSSTKQAGRTQADQADAIRNAARSVEQAQHSVKQSAEALEEAHHGVAVAARNVAEAELDLADAQKDAKRAQLDINEARKDALKDLQDIRREVERSSLTEERAVLNLARAQEDYRKVMADPKSSVLDRREAILRVKEAENDLADTRRENAENAKKLAEEEAKGVEGSDKVVDAKERAADATKRQQDAEYRLVEAQRSLVQSRKRVAEAEYQVAQAKLNVADAERRLQQAQQGTAGTVSAANTAMEKYKEMLDKLSPSARKVFLAVVAMKEAWEDSSKVIQEATYAPVVGQLKNLQSLLPVVENLLAKSGEAIGKVAARGIAMVSSGPWKKDFADQAQANARYIEDMGDAGLYLLDALRHIGRASEPFTTWLTQALKQGAANFRDWAKSARENGDIERFLTKTKQRLQEVWEVTKNIGGMLLSWGKAAEPFTDWMMERLVIITQRWRDVAKAQEEANSPLQKWLQDVKPLLSEVARLFGDIGRALAASASDTGNIERAIALLQSLRTDILPALGKLLHELGESGVDQALVDAFGTILEAIATFLEAGGGTALSTFVTVLAGFVEVLASIASLPGISHILGGIATGLAAIAAVSIVARFTGLFKLVDLFRWFVANRGNLVGALGDAARGLVGVQNAQDGGTRTVAPTTTPNRIVGNGSEVIDQQTRATQRSGTAAGEAATKTGLFARSLQNVRGAAGAARTGISNFAGMIGGAGPLGIALLAATVGITVLATASAEYNGKIDGLKVSLSALGGEYDKLTVAGNNAAAGTDEAIKGIVASNPDLQAAVIALDGLGVSFEQFARAASGQGPDMAGILGVLDQEINTLEDKWKDQSNFLFTVFSDDAQATSDRLAQLRQLKKAIEENGGAMGQAAQASEIMNKETRELTDSEKALGNFIGPVTLEQRRALTQEYEENATKIGSLKDLVGALGDAESTATERSDAFRRAIEAHTSSAIKQNETLETWNGKLLDLEDAVASNGKSLDIQTRAGLRNRDALQEAATATRELYLQDIAAGVPMDKATEKHNDRIKALKEEARRLGLNKEETKKLIDAYGGIPKSIQTLIKPDEKGFDSVYVELSKIAVMQKALQEGKSLNEARDAWNKESNKFYERYIPGKKYATGGAVYGAGTRTSDSIRAWLSNGEFVQPTDAVEHYGMPIMEAIRKRKLDKAALTEALPGNGGMFNKGGHAHGSSCSACASGGAHKYATGGSVNVPIVVTPKNTKIDPEWAQFGGDPGSIGNADGTGGWQWQMRVLRQRFPGLALWSGYRPGSRTLSGNRSYHASGRAVDVAPRRDVAEWIRSNYGARTKELITPFQDLNLHNGKPHTYTGAVWNQHNFAGGNAHDHWAFKNGGLVDYSSMFGFPGMDMGSMLSSKSMPNASPRQLSSAAQSVINQNRGITVENLNVNNPVPERASDSLSRQVTKLAVLGDI